MSETPAARLEADLRRALKAGDRERLSTLRLLLTEVQSERGRRSAEVDEAGFVALVRRAIKQREESAATFRAGGREELAAKEERERAVLAEYLPPAVDEASVRAAVAEILAGGLPAGPAAMGPLMKELKARFGAAVDGATLSRIAREALAGSPGSR